MLYRKNRNSYRNIQVSERIYTLSISIISFDAFIKFGKSFAKKGGTLVLVNYACTHYFLIII